MLKHLVWEEGVRSRGSRVLIEGVLRLPEGLGEMAAVLERTKQKIEERYPDDFVGKAVNYITVVIDGKKALNLLK